MRDGVFCFYFLVVIIAKILNFHAVFIEDEGGKREGKLEIHWI